MFGNFIDSWLDDQGDAIIDSVMELFTDVNGIGMLIVELPVVGEMTRYAQIIAFSLLATKVMFEGWMNYALRMNGDPDSDLSGVIVRAAAAAVMIGAAPALLKMVYQFSIVIGTEIGAASNSGFQGDSLREDVFLAISGDLAGSALVVLVAIVFIAIFLVLIFIQTFIRGAEIAFAAIVGPILALGITKETSGAWSGWVKEMLALCFTSLGQLAMIKMAFVVLLLGTEKGESYVNAPGFKTMFDNNMVRILLFLCLLWVAYKVPAAVKGFAHTTGVSKAVGGAATTVIRNVLAKKT